MKTIVKKHYRKIKGKKVKVKKHTRKIKGNAVISSKKRKVLTDMLNRDFELGGYLDFEKNKGLENMKVHFGNKYAVEFDEDPDYELQFHSHGNLPGVTIMPSDDDILGMLDSPQKEQLIFHKNAVLSIFEYPKFKKVNRGRLRAYLYSLQKDFLRGMNDRQLYNRYKPIFRKELGLDMKWHEPNKPIRLKTEAI